MQVKKVEDKNWVLCFAGLLHRITKTKTNLL